MKINNIKLMNRQIKTIFVLAFALVMSATSCLNEVSDQNGGENVLPGNVESLDSQVAAMKTSVGDFESVAGALVGVVEDLDAEALKAELESCSALVQDHIASVENGAQAVASTVKAIELQGRIAETVGALKAQVELLEANGQTRVLLERIQTLEEGVASWLGDKFENYYLVSSDLERVNEFNSVAKEQALSVDALQSDVEAGLRKDDQSGDLAKVASSVSESAKLLAEQQSSLSALASELETGYVSAIKSSTSESKSTLKALNTKAAAARTAADNTLEGLIERVAVCEGMIKDLYTRLEQLDARVDELLRMIQSLTFVSEYSSDKAVAYYTMSPNLNPDRQAEGKKDRVPASTFDLNFLVRPASAAAALADESLWNDGLSIVGYYAPQIQLTAVNDANFIGFEIERVESTENGMVTVTVKNSFSDDFYFKEIGAKLALSVESGMNSCMSKFVEIVPVDASGKVYAESLSLSESSISIQNGDTYQLTAVVSPSNVTDKGCTWEDYGSEYLTVDANGKITATAVGKQDVVVWANATDEFGRQLSATCKVNVTAAVRVLGPGSVEIGKSAKLEVDSPDYIEPANIEWELEAGTNRSYLSLAKNEDGTCTITGLMSYYNDSEKQYTQFNVKCKIGGFKDELVIMHPVCVIEVQPKAIAIEGLASDQNKKTVKINEQFKLSASIMPETVKTEFFKLNYSSNNPGVVSCNNITEVYTAVHYGDANLNVKVTDNASCSYFYPSRNEFVRTIYVTVEPYWVKSMTLPGTYKMAPEGTSTLTPDWISDVDGVVPSDQTLTWSSSDPTVVSIDASTGQMTALKEGTATITATTSGAHSVPSGTAPISSSCFVTVETPTVPINVGDYYYSDGTWSSTPDNNKTVIGVIFSKFDATGSDTRLRSAYPNVTHGLVVGINEFTSAFGDHTKDDYKSNSTYAFFYSKGWPLTPREDDAQVVLGYTHTQALIAYKAYRGGNYAALVNVLDGLAAPQGGSTWYIPSFAEMKLLKDNAGVVNGKLESVGGKLLQTDAYYWPSTLMKGPSYNDHITQPFNMSTGTWKDASDKWDNEKTKTYPVRVVFAF